MHLAYPTNVWWLVPVALVAALGVWELVRRAQALRRLRLVGVRVRSGGLARFGTRTLALAFIGLALLGPCWGELEVPLPPARGRDLMVLLDVSRSMLAEDVQPNRLEHARRQLQTLAQALASRGGYRIGLIAFADRPVLLCPLTTDYRHFQEELKSANLLSVRLREGNAPSGAGTQLGGALRRARQLLPVARVSDPVDVVEAKPASQRPATACLDILLVSDGGDESAAGLEETVTSLKESSVAVHALGVGDPSRASPIPVQPRSGRREFLQHEGQVVTVTLEEAGLRQLAQRTGGVYLTAKEHADVPVQLLAGLSMKEQRELETQAQTTIPMHQFAWFLLPAIVLLLLERVIPSGSVQAQSRKASPWLTRLVPPPASRQTGVSAAPTRTSASSMNYFSRT